MTEGASRQPAPCVSVLMTAYNRERFIGASIESVLQQTCGDFELIVCDDASTDRTMAIAEQYAARDGRIRVTRNGTNLGQFSNRNQAATLARGRYLKFHDSDDVMYPHCLQVMVRALDSEPRAGLALSGPHAWFGGPSPMLLTPELAYEREFLGSGLFQLGPSCALFRAETFRSLGGFTPDGISSDYRFWFKACARTNVLLVPADLFYYRIHDGQELSSRRTALDYARARRYAWSVLNSSECPLRGAALEQAKRNFVFTVARDAYRYARRGEHRAAAASLAELGLRPLDWLRYLRPPRRSAAAGTPHPAVPT
jgi:glycosyltransferase involved in cell wall biosynthesis